jgi:hypothetical protein
MAATGLQRSCKPTDVSGGCNVGLNHGLPVWSQWCGRGCGEDGRETSRRGTVVALKRMGSNGLKNRPRWGEEREKLSVSAF